MQDQAICPALSLVPSPGLLPLGVGWPQSPCLTR